MPQTPGSRLLTSPVTLAAQATCRYCKAFTEAAALQEWPSQIYPILSLKISSAIMQVSVLVARLQHLHSARKQLLHQIPIRRKKKVLPAQKPLDSVRGQEPHLQFSSAIVLSCKRRFSGHSAPACLLSLHVFPCTGQAAKQVQQPPLAAAGVPSLMPRLLKQRERGARHGKGSEGAGRELILAISRKETEVLNALLAEIPSKWEKPEPSSGTSPSISDCKTHQPEGISC